MTRIPGRKEMRKQRKGGRKGGSNGVWKGDVVRTDARMEGRHKELRTKVNGLIHGHNGARKENKEVVK